MDRRAAFLETLDAFRPDLQALADRNAAFGLGSESQGQSVRAAIPARFFTRRIARFSVVPNHRWLDVRSPESHVVLREELSGVLAKLGIAGTSIVSYQELRVLRSPAI